MIQPWAEECRNIPPDGQPTRGDGSKLLGEELGHIFEGLEFQRIAAGIEKEHRRLFTDLSFEADMRFDHELNGCLNCGICTATCPAAHYYDFSPREIVSELDRFIVGQPEAKRAVALALRNLGDAAGADEAEVLYREALEKQMTLMQQRHNVDARGRAPHPSKRQHFSQTPRHAARCRLLA